MAEMIRAWHFLRDDMRSGSGAEPAWTEGEERTITGRLKLCDRGYHSSPTPWDALQYAPGSMLCLVEISEPVKRDKDKAVSRTRRLVRAINIERELRLFACDCAESAVEIVRTRGAKPDPRSLAAIATARRFANGGASVEELDAAAPSAAEAARAAAEAAWAAWAAWAAAEAASAARAARAAAEAAKAQFNEMAEALYQISDGTLILPFVQHNGTDPTTAFVIKSTDNGQTWGSPIVISNPLTGWIFPYGNIIELPDSTLLLSVYGKNTGETTKSLLMQSTDAGATWSLKSTIANDAANNYNETDVLRLDANNYLAVIRRTASPDNVYKVTSSDGGNTWGSPTLLFEGVSPDLVELNNGDILLCVGDRSGTEGIRCQISQNDGLTWSNGTMIFTGPAGQTSNGGYPASFQLSNGNIFTTYYHLISGANTDVSRTIYSEDYILNSNTNNFFEGMEDGNLNDWAVAQGTTTSVSSSIKHSGTYSFYHNDTDTLIQNRGVRSLYSTGQSTGVVSFWLYPDTYSFTFGLNDGTVTGSDERFWLSIHPDGSVKYHNGTAWTSLSTATTLSADTWSKFTIKFNASTNQAEVFINGSSKGNITQRFTGGNISHIEFGTWSTVGTGYVFYVDDIYIHQYVSTMPSSSVGSQVSIYDSNNPIINPTVANAQPFTSLSGFSETATKHGGQIKYQISHDSGTTWYWYNPGWTTTSSGYTEANTASDINSNISTFPVGSGSFLFKAYLNSDGTQLVQLDSVNLTYINDITGPTVSAVSSTPTSAGATITWTTNEDSSSKVDYGLTNSYGSTTTETDTTTRVQTHSVTLSGLSSCTTYHYRARSIDAALN